MNRDQVKNLFKVLVKAYPSFEVDAEKVDIWTSIMKNMDYERVMARAQEHIQTNKFPPTIAEISAFAPKKDDTLEKMRQWEEEAKKVPTHVKQNFEKQIKKLFEDKAK